MLVGRVMGAVASSTKKTELTGMKLLMVKEIAVATLKDKSDLWIGIDTVGAGEGDIVMLVRGSSSRCLPGYKDTPADCTVGAIFDTIDIHGERIYEKFVKEIDRKEQ